MTMLRSGQSTGVKRHGELKAAVSRAGLHRTVEPLLAFVALVTLVTCAAMGEKKVFTSSSVSTSHSGVHSEPVASTAPSVAPLVLKQTGHSTLETSGATRFQRFRSALKQLGTAERVTSVRILWFGDSHTAADYFPNAVRKSLAKIAPSGGPGYVSLGIPGFRHGLARVWSEGDLELAPHPPARRTPEGDGVFGLGGTRVTLVDTSAFITARAISGSSTEPMTYELSYRLSTDGDIVRIKVGDARYELTTSAATPIVRNIRQFRWNAQSDTTIEIRALRGKPQLFGIVMEGQSPGVVLDTLGINGARFGTVLAWQEDVTVALVAQRAPSLIVVAYGTNEVFDAEPVVHHTRRLEDVIARLRRGAPEADCLVVGPTDAAKGGESTRLRTAAIDAAERATAERVSCEYFSPFEMMIREGGYESWSRADPPLALSDGIHLTVRGYTRLGEALSDALLNSK